MVRRHLLLVCLVASCLHLATAGVTRGTTPNGNTDLPAVCSVSGVRTQSLDDGNCLTYYDCENDYPRALCCAPGYGYDSATGECQPNPNCQDHCPPQFLPDVCSVSGVRTQSLDDGKCITYWGCENGNPRPLCCAPGYGYDSATGECQANANCQDDCPAEYLTDVCGKITATGPVMSYSLFDGNCRSFIKCNPKGYGEAFCCRQHFYYNSQKQRCDSVGTVLDPCYMTTCPGGYTEECRYQKIPGNPMAYMDVDVGIELTCPAGTVKFDENICRCSGRN